MSDTVRLTYVGPAIYPFGVSLYHETFEFDPSEKQPLELPAAHAELLLSLEPDLWVKVDVMLDSRPAATTRRKSDVSEPPTGE